MANQSMHRAASQATWPVPAPERLPIWRQSLRPQRRSVRAVNTAGDDPLPATRQPKQKVPRPAGQRVAGTARAAPGAGPPGSPQHSVRGREGETGPRSPAGPPPADAFHQRRQAAGGHQDVNVAGRLHAAHYRRPVRVGIEHVLAENFPHQPQHLLSLRRRDHLPRVIPLGHVQPASCRHLRVGAGCGADIQAVKEKASAPPDHNAMVRSGELAVREPAPYHPQTNSPGHLLTGANAMQANRAG
jgi:hypothetical protein